MDIKQLNNFLNSNKTIYSQGMIIQLIKIFKIFH